MVISLIPAPPPQLLPENDTQRFHILFVFRTIPLWAALVLQDFLLSACHFPFRLLRSAIVWPFTCTLRTLLWPRLTSHSSLLLRCLRCYPSVRSPRVLTRSFPLIPALFTLSDSVQLLGFGLFGSLTLTYGLIQGFCSSGQRFALRSRLPSQSGFLQIPPRDGPPCL